MKVVLASNNAKKLEELRRILEPLASDVEVVGLREALGESAASYREPAETEPTFEGNALIKARAALEVTGLPALADDSGLCVDALNGMPGVLSARWSGLARSDGADEANNRLLLAQLAEVPDERRGAEFRCAMAFCAPGGVEAVEVGAMPGRVLRAERGDGGFGYDPLFAPAGHDVSAAELSRADKDAISHRGRALRAIAPAVAAHLAGRRDRAH